VLQYRLVKNEKGASKLNRSPFFCKNSNKFKPLEGDMKRTGLYAVATF